MVRIPSEIGNAARTVDLCRLTDNYSVEWRYPNRDWNAHKTVVHYRSQTTMDWLQPIPTEIGMLTKLSSLSLTDNEGLTGTIPTEIGMLTKLSSLSLTDNHRLAGRFQARSEC
jgi:hypothetical protein